MVKILSITADKFEAGEYQDLFPEIYELKDYIENSAWHNKQSVYDHIIKVIRGFEDVLEFRFLSEKEKLLVRKYIKKKVGNVSRYELMILVAVLHDNAKNDTLVKREDGSRMSRA